MLFNSLEFLVFFPIVVALYYLIPYKYRWIFLLVCSYYFYICWKEEYIFLIALSTLIDYYCGLKMSMIDNKQSRKPFLLISLITNLSLLFGFKYFNFASDSLNVFFGSGYGNGPIPSLDILLPVGISFYTFQTLSYSIDIYKGRMQAEKNILKFALYVSFFPQLVAGPIERAKRLLPQINLQHSFNYENIKYGIILMLWGFFKKMVIADRIGEYVNTVYSQPEHYENIQVWIANMFFLIQIYCDFGGYADIAIGSAAILGYKLMINFRQPLFAQDVQEFWNRWHISLTTWFRDYVYAELGGRKKGITRWYINVWLIFFMIGIWHGAAWNFFIFGASHGLLVVATIAFRSRAKRLKQSIGLTSIPNLETIVNIIFTFMIVSFTSIFFRGGSLDNMGMLIKQTFNFEQIQWDVNLFRYKADMYISIISISFMLFVEYFEWNGSLNDKLDKWPRSIKYLVFLISIIAFVLLAKFKEMVFIYFQF